MTSYLFKIGSKFEVRPGNLKFYIIDVRKLQKLFLFILFNDIRIGEPCKRQIRMKQKELKME